MTTHFPEVVQLPRMAQYSRTHVLTFPKGSGSHSETTAMPYPTAARFDHGTPSQRPSLLFPKAASPGKQPAQADH